MASKHGTPTPRNRQYRQDNKPVPRARVPGQTDPIQGATWGDVRRAEENLANPQGASWEDLENLYRGCVALTTTPANLVPLLRDREAIKQVADPKALLESATVVNKDVAEYNQRLKAIHNKHADRPAGLAATPDDMMEILSIGEEYEAWQASYQSVVLTNTASTLAMFQSAGVTVPDAADAAVEVATQPNPTEESKS